MVRAFSPSFSAVLVVPFLLAQAVSADEKLKDIACRSVHLAYSGPTAVLFHNDVKVEKTADGTYFCVCGFNRGYFGLQELANGKKLAIFSVWDPTNEQDPRKVPEDKRVKLLHKDDSVRVGRFGNEGTGGQSLFDFEWKIGETYRFVVTAEPQGERTAYAGWIRLPEAKEWKHLVTFSTISGGKQLGGYYAFIEDFRRNKISTTKERRAEFGDGWVMTADGKWSALEEARFTADANPVLNIDAGLAGSRFWLATGGSIANAHTPLRQSMKRPAGEPPHLPEELLRTVRKK